MTDRDYFLEAIGLKRTDEAQPQPQKPPKPEPDKPEPKSIAELIYGHLVKETKRK